MASSKGKTEDVVTSAGYDDTQFEWENVHEEAPTQIILDTVGDKFTGLYTGKELVEFDDNKGEHNEFWQYRFRVSDELLVMNGFYELDIAMKEIPSDSMVRITLIKFVDVGQASKMKSIRVDVAKPRTA